MRIIHSNLEVCFTSAPSWLASYTSTELYLQCMVVQQYYFEFCWSKTVDLNLKWRIWIMSARYPDARYSHFPPFSYLFYLSQSSLKIDWLIISQKPTIIFNIFAILIEQHIAMWPKTCWHELALHITHQRTHSTHTRLSVIPDPFLCPTTVIFS